MTGIYKIENQVNGKVYIGQSINITQRWRQHRTYYQIDMDKVLYKAMRKYGIENFSFEVIEECEATKLNDREIYWIEYYNSYYEGYNSDKGGSTGYHPIKLSDDDVLEIINLLEYSSLTQRDIAKMFQVGEDTISEINQGKTRVQVGVSYPIRKRIVKNICPICGAKKDRQAKLCLSCANKERQTVERPDRDTLKAEIRNKSFVELGNKYGVTDNAIKRWCKAYNLPCLRKDIKAMSDEEWENV